MAKILIVGCGSLGYGLAELLATAGHEVTGIKRNAPPTSPGNFAIESIDITSPQDLERLDTDFEHVFFIVSADSRNEASYRDIYEKAIDNILNKFAKDRSRAPWFFVSSTSVYGQNKGEWVDENSVVAPSKKTSQLIIQAEEKLKSSNPENVIVRFSGIYGPGREYLLTMAKQSPSIPQDPPYYTNRIHQRDCVDVLQFLFEQRLAGILLEPCYVASDDDPAPLWDVINWLAGEMGCNPPMANIAEQYVDMNKRCRNDRLKKLGFRFSYPNYKTGYIELIKAAQ